MPMSSARAESRARADRGLKRSAVEFDAFACSYQEYLNHSVRISGDTSDYFAAYKAAFIARKLAPSVGKLLDYGCGIGLLAGHLKHRFPSVQIDGFDVSQDCIGQIDKNLAQQGAFTSDLNATGHSYDVVVLSNVLHHVKPENRAHLILDIRSRLAENGKLVIFEHNPINPLTRWAVSQCVFDEDAILLTSREMLRDLRAADLRVLARDFVVFFPRYLAWLRPFEPFLRWCPLGAQYAVIADRTSG
jgi:2-polyprenyl-3-methyl-5-hydroxy-6-metoxy-1,4-benzoquinol methylase